MAYFAKILTPDNLLLNESVNSGGTAGTDVTVAARKVFLVAVDGPMFYNTGTSSVTVDASTNVRGYLPGAGVYTFDSGNRFTHFRLYNNGSSAVRCVLTDAGNS